VALRNMIPGTAMGVLVGDLLAILGPMKPQIVGK